MHTRGEFEVTDVVPSPVVLTVAVNPSPNVPPAGRFEMTGVVGVSRLGGWNANSSPRSFWRSISMPVFDVRPSSYQTVSPLSSTKRKVAPAVSGSGTLTIDSHAPSSTPAMVLSVSRGASAGTPSHW